MNNSALTLSTSSTSSSSPLSGSKKNENSTTTLDNIATDVALTIFSYLSARDLSQVAVVSKNCKKHAQDKQLWTKFNAINGNNTGDYRLSYIRNKAWNTGRAVHISPIRKVDKNIQDIHDVHLLSSSLNSFVVTGDSNDEDVFRKFYDEENDFNIYNVGIHKQSNNDISDRVIKNVVTDYNIYSDQFFSAFTMSNTNNNDDDFQIYSTNVTPASNNLFSGNDSKMPRIKRIFNIRRNDVITASDISSSITDDELNIIIGTKRGNLYYNKIPTLNNNAQHNNLNNLVNNGSNVIKSVKYLENGHNKGIIGSSGGEINEIDLERGIKINDYIGPCQCSINSISHSIFNNIIITGVSHKFTGNGHNHLLIAFDLRSKSRICSFGRDINKSKSSKLLNVNQIKCNSNNNIGTLINKEEINCYDIRNWKLLFNINSSNTKGDDDSPINSIDLNSHRFTYANNNSISVLDFDRAIQKFPHQVTSFQPQTIKPWPCPVSR